MIDPLLSITASVFTGCLLVASGVHKLADLAGFRTTLAAYRILPAGTLAVAAPVIAVAEIAAGVAAAVPGAPFQRAGLTACILLLGIYAAVILFSISRGNRFIGCGCLGFAARRPGLTAGMALRNLGVIAVAIVALLPSGGRALTWLDGTAVAGGVGMSALLYLGFDLLITLPARKTAS